MNNLKSKILSISLLVILITFSIASLTVYAATDTYNSTIIFKGEHIGKTYEFTHDNISYSATAYSTYNGKEISADNDYDLDDTYTVSLYKQGFIYSEKVGSKELSRYTSGSAEWTDVGAGKYFFYFSKTRDGADVHSDDIIMKGF